jgi:hypothetical protein
MDLSMYRGMRVTDSIRAILTKGPISVIVVRRFDVVLHP